MEMKTMRRPSNRFLVSMTLLLVLPLTAVWTISGLGIQWWDWWDVRTGAPAHPGAIERIDPDDPAHQFHYGEALQEHLAQYQFAVQYSKEHHIQSVADIASGTCYGMKMLKEVVPVVDGYDREDFCGNYVIDLDKADWNRQYDAIVSFETVEHLEKPEFFLVNAARSSPILLLSTPVNTGPGNDFHKQLWTTEQFQELLERYYSCEYYHRVGDRYEPGHIGGVDLFAVCERRNPPPQSSSAR
ncbi:MAG: hypothetical protein ACRD88_14335 [Terriglobia bacterium]